MRDAPFGELIDVFAQHVMAFPFGNGHPGFFVWGNSSPALEGVLAALLAAAMNPSCAGRNHAAARLESPGRALANRRRRLRAVPAQPLRREFRPAPDPLGPAD
ncbi:MAG: hypothetical protein OEY41_12910 [Acidimicrobiia bacterium]|nr:hypothetical protein [Acidimicrobiia bacterium]